MKAREEWLGMAMIIILLLNDHVLKSWHPGWITGKLSDLAGPFVFFMLLRGIPPFGLKPKAAFTITLTFAIAIKISQPLADFVSGAACGWIFASCGFIADPWDLMAYIPFALWFAWAQREFNPTNLSPSAAYPGTSPDR